nr:pentatricopeptide repeat-containing protein At3g02490, mitochondrial-like [Quercus suber]
MRHQWRLLLRPHHILRSQLHNTIHSSSHFQVLSNPNLNLPPFRSLTSLFHNTVSQKPQFINPRDPISRGFSSEPEQAIEEKDTDHTHLVVADIFAKPTVGVDDIRKELELNNVVISHELVLRVLGNLESSPDVAKRFFDWVLESNGQKLSSKSYNSMLGILGVNGFVKEFWDLVEVMNKKGYGISKGVQNKVLERFQKDGLGGYVEKLRAVYASGLVDNSVEKVCSKLCKIVRSEVWSDDVERQIRELGIEYSSDMVKKVLENVGVEPTKALIFFRWVEESGLFKHDERTYNAMAKVLGREDCIDRFWKVVDEMRSNGYDMEEQIFVKVLGRFCKRKMIKDAVDLYEFSMAGANKPSEDCCVFLLRKVAVGKQLDMGLFLRVVRIFTESGNLLTNSMLGAVLKSLTSVGRLGECNKVLKAMKEGGFVANGHLQSKIAFQLSSTGKKDEASELMENMEASGSTLDHRTWASFIEGHCVAGDLDKASDCFKQMVEKEGVSSAGYALHILVNAYCQKNRAIEACMLLVELVNVEQLKPWHTTYKELISKLLVQGGFQNALSLLGLMKNQGFPPFVDPFIEYVSKSGTGDDAINFLKEMTSKRFPAISVFLRTFEAFFKAGRHFEAQNFLSKCPVYIRNHADVLNLFYSMKSRKGSSATNVAA